MHTAVRRKATSLASAAILVGAVLVGVVTTPKESAIAAPAPASSGNEYKVLVFDGGTGVNSATTAAGVAAIRKLGNEMRFVVEVTGDPGKFDLPHLKQFRSVVFLNTSGAAFTDAERSAFEAYFHDGGGFVGIHSAIETEPGWQFLTDIIGTRSTGKSGVTNATAKVADRVHPASAGLPEYWKIKDAFYNFAADVRGVEHVLATVDETTYSGGTMGPDHPIMWCKDYKGGRSFYTGLGDTTSEFNDSSFQGNLGGAIDWAAGNGSGDCGATILANYQMSVVAAPPNIGEPIEIEVL